jgi:hypothetical protein
MEAAKAAIGYEKLRLAAIKGKVEGRLTLAELVTASFRPDRPATPGRES